MPDTSAVPEDVPTEDDGHLDYASWWQGYQDGHRDARSNVKRCGCGTWWDSVLDECPKCGSPRLLPDLLVTRQYERDHPEDVKDGKLRDAPEASECGCQ